MKKLKILLVVDYISWILGTWAKQIFLKSKAHEYLFFSTVLIDIYPEYWNELISSVDIVHFLTPFEIDRFKIPKNTVVINSIHHIIKWEKIESLTHANAIMVVAQEWKHYLHMKGVPDKKIIMINNGVDLDFFQPYSKHEARQKLNCNFEGIIVVFSAKLTSNQNDRKGVDIFVNSLKHTRRSGIKIGTMITGPGWNKLVYKLKKNGIQVFYYPFIQSHMMPFFYSAVDIYLITSKIEGGPAPLLESMACRTPVITTPVGIAIDYIQNNVNGILVEKNSVDSTSSAIQNLAMSPDIRERLSHMGLETIKQHLSWNKVLKEIDKTYIHVWEESTIFSSNIIPRKEFSSYYFRNSDEQRQWTITVDLFLWSLELFQKGYIREGLEGIIKLYFERNIWKINLIKLTGLFFFSKIKRKLNKKRIELEIR